MEAVIPLEAGLPTLHTDSFDPDQNAEALAKDLDLAEEKRDAAQISIAAYQQTLAQSYNKMLQVRSFKPDDLVLRRAVRAHKKQKLGPNWEGPYRVIRLTGPNSYFLETLDERKIPRPRNAKNLCMYYH